MNHTELAAVLHDLAKFAGDVREITVKGRKNAIVSASVPYGAVLPRGWYLVGTENKLQRIEGYVRVAYSSEMYLAGE